MNIGIVGIGGVGGYYGGKLAKEYENSPDCRIVFIARGKHLDEIKNKGLKLYTREDNFIARPFLATDNPDHAGIFDIVFFCVKSYNLEESAHLLKKNINQNTIVIPLLNGVNISERLGNILPAGKIIKGLVYISSFVDQPGIVRQIDGSCKLAFGTDDASAEQYKYIQDILLKAKIDASLTGSISQAQWIKYLLICPLGGLTAATGKTFGAIMEDKKLKNELRGLIEEVKSIAYAKKVDLPPDIIDKTLELVGRFAYNTKSSLQMDKERGKKMELDIFTEYVRKTARQLGISTPLNDRIYDQLLR